MNDSIATALTNVGYMLNAEDLYILPDEIKNLEPEEQRTYSTSAETINLFWKHNNKEELIEKLHSIAENVWGDKLEKQEPYIVSRVVNPTSINESFRSHFDSHLVTIVVPIEVPKGEKYKQGELLVLPRKRSFPKSGIINIIQKLFYGSIFYRWYLRSNFRKLESTGNLNVMDIGSFENLVFNGLTTLHCNLPFENNKIRRTLLIHYGDPDTKGIGALLRKLRNR
ncbi:hypothetical protein [Pseudemcibacter aquimaris]|uniref:hypothetical protein n=1 Tax=Pseudemcibacter aquimaris TaxID=2857064 RepID=UPI00201153F7|nr:hypothetical protein [Pseudemcibacter aquimaris]MCC3861731.1 hypothetical protein [Pseudemcibacter aquimaris]WDU58500.1 hypothetical protein KW060_15015 [Pseudemcibacter aquimaris]